MIKIDFKSLLILALALSVLGALILVTVNRFVTYTPQTTSSRSVAPLDTQSSSTATQKVPEIISSSSVKPLGLISETRKSAQGIIRSIKPDSITIANAFDEQTYKLGAINTVTLTTVTIYADTKKRPESVVSDIKVADLKVYDQVDLRLVDRGDGFVVTEIYVSRKIEK